MLFSSLVLQPRARGRGSCPLHLPSLGHQLLRSPASAVHREPYPLPAWGREGNPPLPSSVGDHFLRAVLQTLSVGSVGLVPGRGIHSGADRPASQRRLGPCAQVRTAGKHLRLQRPPGPLRLSGCAGVIKQVRGEDGKWPF